MSNINSKIVTSTGKEVSMHDAKLIISMLEFSSDPSFEQTVDWEAFAQANGYKHAASGRNQYAKAKARLGLVGKKASGASTTPKKASEPSSSTGPAITKKTTGVTKNRSCPKVNVASKKLEDSDEDEFISLVKVDNSDE